MSERIYQGRREPGRRFRVYVTDEGGGRRDLDPRHDLDNRAPGFEWGTVSPSATQLALALIADATGDDQRALQRMQAFKHRFVASLAREWTAMQSTVLLVLAAIERDTERAPARRFNPNMYPGRRGRT